MMNGDVNQVAGSKRATKRRMSSVSNEDSGEGTKRPANGFTMSIDERNELRMKEKKGEVDYSYFQIGLQTLTNRVILFNFLSAQNDVSEKVTKVVEREFAVSIEDKEKEIFEIDRRLLQIKKALHLVRYGAVTNYYALTVDKVMNKMGAKRLKFNRQRKTYRMHHSQILTSSVMTQF